VPPGAAGDTLVAGYNDLAGVEALLEANPAQVAAVIVEPVAGNMGVVLPEPDFLPGLRNLTRQYGALLIFDEVMTGFRVALGGAQAFYDVMPDLTTLGKVIGGGLPVGAYAGRREIMKLVAPAGPVYQAGTLSGNPLAMTAGIETLSRLREPGVFETLAARSEQLCAGIGEAARKAGVPVYQTRAGTMFCTFFLDAQVRDWARARMADTRKYGRFFRSMLERGVYLAPSQFEAGFMSTAHDDVVIRATLEAAEVAFDEIA
jgi:glutamate-1-semialdehyde 2,1-aminomutase